MTSAHDDIEKYLRGELTPQEQHALEKRALDDPFLREALEGAESIDAQDFGADLAQLKTDLALRTKRKSGGAATSPYYWPLRIAAAVLLLAASTFLVIQLSENNDRQQSQELAANKSSEPEITEKDSAVTKNQVEGDSSTKDKLLALDSKTHTDEEKPQRARKAEDGPVTQPSVAATSESPQQTQTASQPVPITEKPKPAEAERADDLAKADEVSDDTDAVMDKSDVLTKKESRSAIAKKEPNQLRDSANIAGVLSGRAAGIAAGAPVVAYSLTGKKLKGKVTDLEDGVPLPGVNVFVKGTSIGTVTDVNGEYEITIPDGNETLIFSFIGLQSQEVAVGKDSTLDLAMSPDVSQLSEVVVVGYGTEGYVQPENYETFELAEPEGGRRDYKRYLEQNLLYPQVALENNVEGKVTVQFTVEPSGQLSDFKVVRGIGYGCEEEVIRLIKAGPHWKPTKRNDEPIRGKVKVRLKFELPQKKKK